ncbi:hypothetical protein NA57DRAFT_61740 [Rhizodiscina lignyota]|uniref:Uncharacterized protein n=1 Tax=Rhizodiscina lignyota TaxID=1504668 RepID=A0A9P4I5T4_9PEZI|nr:hypothetical protein NA57DRAFT_61740 [Rhizodiscina lignyota]
MEMIEIILGVCTYLALILPYHPAVANFMYNANEDETRQESIDPGFGNTFGNFCGDARSSKPSVNDLRARLHRLDAVDAEFEELKIELEAQHAKLKVARTKLKDKLAELENENTEGDGDSEYESNEDYEIIDEGDSNAAIDEGNSDDHKGALENGVEVDEGNDTRPSRNASESLKWICFCCDGVFDFEPSYD